MVAWADAEHVMPCGWPAGIAEASNCELIKECSDEEHRALVKEIAVHHPRNEGGFEYDNDLRHRRVWQLYLEQVGAEKPAEYAKLKNALVVRDSMRKILADCDANVTKAAQELLGEGVCVHL